MIGIHLDQLEIVLEENLQKRQFVFGVLSKPRNKSLVSYHKVSIRPVELRGRPFYHVTYHFLTQENHENLDLKETKTLILQLLEGIFRQAFLFTILADWQILVSKKGSLRLIKHPPSRTKADLDHDRVKSYLLQEGTPIPFLVELGIMTSDGQVRAKRQAKFRQLNKFLEIVGDCLVGLQKDLTKPVRVVDFGSGRAYLTFALYHYLVEQLGLVVDIVGLDLKEEAVLFCNQTARNLGYENLRFFHQDIRHFQTEDEVDIVVSLHACDVATDFALAQAVKWGAQLILAVPCCQHELYGQLAQSIQKPLLEHGIVKERLAALVTDAARAKLLETVGYAVTIMEFVDLEHTAKNLLIRAQRQATQVIQVKKEYLNFKEFWRIEPTLEALLKKENFDVGFKQ